MIKRFEYVDQLLEKNNVEEELKKKSEVAFHFFNHDDNSFYLFLGTNENESFVQLNYLRFLAKRKGLEIAWNDKNWVNKLEDFLEKEYDLTVNNKIDLDILYNADKNELFDGDDDRLQKIKRVNDMFRFLSEFGWIIRGTIYNHISLDIFHTPYECVKVEGQRPPKENDKFIVRFKNNAKNLETIKKFKKEIEDVEFIMSRLIEEGFGEFVNLE